MRILLTGATGFIGLELLRNLPNNIEGVSVLSRNQAGAESRLRGISKTRCFKWNAENEVAPAAALEGIDVVVHLAGENIGAGRWSKNVKNEILDSRVLGTRNLVAGIARMAKPPVLISASAIGFYGDSGDTPLTEESPNGTGFLAEVCEAWEHEARKAVVSRLVIPRFGVVFGKGGGALSKLLPLFKAGLGGRSGNGRQWMGWIHRDDLVAFLLQAVSDPRVSGTYNLVAPEAVQNREFVQTLGRVLHRPALFPVPTFALKLALGEMAEQTILSSQRVKPGRLENLGYSFRFPKLEGALRQIAAP